MVYSGVAIMKEMLKKPDDHNERLSFVFHESFVSILKYYYFRLLEHKAYCMTVHGGDCKSGKIYHNIKSKEKDPIYDWA